MRLRDAIRDVTLPIGRRRARAPRGRGEQIAPLPGTTHRSRARDGAAARVAAAAGRVVLAATMAAIRIMAMSRRGAAWGFALVAIAWSLLCGLLG